jgi:hypothetical protein
VPATGLPVTSGAAKPWLLPGLFQPPARSITGTAIAVALLRPASIILRFMASFVASFSG